MKLRWNEEHEKPVCFHCGRELTLSEVRHWAESGLKVAYIHCNIHVEEAFAKSREDARAATTK